MSLKGKKKEEHYLLNTDPTRGPKRKFEPFNCDINKDNEFLDDEGVNYFEDLLENDSDVDCNTWDKDCKIVTKYSISGGLSGYHLMPTCMRNPDLHPKKKHKFFPEINSDLLNDSLKTYFKQCWIGNRHIVNNSLELIVDPFKVCVVQHFIQNESVLDEIRQEIYELDFNTRSMDLYEFFQSKDLKYLKSEQIKNVYNFLKENVMKWVAELTGLNLTHISATCSVYSNTDYLLVHDDQREDRMVAFVLYLAGPEQWNESKGGALQLLSKDKDGQPSEIVRNIFPANNQLVFFPVTSDSYHQVAEVTTLDECRMSINGWFHTNTAPIFETPQFKPLENGLYSKCVLYPKNVDIDLESWINEDYLDPEAITVIQSHIEEDSEISLKHFLKQESFNEILENLENTDLQWIKVGPPNRYRYEVIDLRRLPHSVERFLSLFQSTEMAMLLQRYTDLELTTPSAAMKFELQRWTPGCYSLLTDYDWQEKNELDLIMYFGCAKSSDVIGARTQYVTIEDEIQNALITLEPEQNNLNIVYRDSARFTKYFSKQSKCRCFYTLVCSYSE